MSRIRLGWGHGVQARPRRAAAVLAAACTLATAGVPLAGAPPASARFIDVGHRGALVLRPLPASFACAMQAALANRHLPCR